MAEVKNSRVYRTVYKSNWRDMIPRILVSGKHVNFVKIDTTGLDPMNSEMIGIVIARGHFKDNVLIPDDTFATLIRPTNPIPPEITEKNGITNEMVANAPDLSTVMMHVCEFLGTEATIVGLQVQEFLAGFLCTAAQKTGAPLNVAIVLDLLHMAQALMEPKKGFRYRYIDILTSLDIATDTGIMGYVDMFNKLYLMIPTGIEKASITSVSAKEYSYTSSWLYVSTNYGSVRLNRSNGYWEETIPGFFDLVDIEALTQTLFAFCGVSDMRSIIHSSQFPSKYFK